MAQKKGAQPEELPKPSLTVPRREAERLIRRQIEKGRTIQNQSVPNEQILEEVRSQRTKWASYNMELLKRLFDNDSTACEYRRCRMRVITSDKLANFQKDMQAMITGLEAIVERLELIPELPEATSPEESVTREDKLGSDVFIVHGRDEAAKDAVARFIEKLELRPIILHEQPNQGRTVIEKFEHYANVGFAVVLLTPDDAGASAGDISNLQQRARQNVVLELGFFLGRLGRDRVCALYGKGVEIPTDYSGVLYIPLEQDWRLPLAKEIKAAGISIDLNNAV